MDSILRWLVRPYELDTAPPRSPYRCGVTGREFRGWATLQRGLDPEVVLCATGHGDSDLTDEALCAQFCRECDPAFQRRAEAEGRCDRASILKGVLFVD